jgi:flagellar biogenesis protein FliO
MKAISSLTAKNHQPSSRQVAGRAASYAMIYLLGAASPLIAEIDRPAGSVDLAIKPGKPAVVTPKKEVALTLGKVDVEVENDLTIVSAKLSKLPPWKDLAVEDHGTYIQVNLPETYVPTSGEFFDGNGPYLKKMAAFEVSDKVGALRLFVGQDAAKVKMATNAEVLGERLVVTIDHKKLEQLIDVNKSESRSKEATSVVATVVSDASAKTSVEPAKVDVTSDTLSTGKIDTQSTRKGSEVNDATESAVLSDREKVVTKKIDGAKSSNANDVQVGEHIEQFNFQGKLIGVAAFCAVMLMGLIATTLLKKKSLRRKKQSGMQDRVEPASMRVLSSINVSARQKLQLIQVGQQQILIGVSTDQISYITTVEPTRRNGNESPFSKQLLQANPNAEVKLKAVDQIAEKPAQRRPAEASTVGGPGRTEKQGATVQSKRIAFGVGDDGIENLNRRSAKTDIGTADQPFDEITKLIRDRLKNMPGSP